MLKLYNIYNSPADWSIKIPNKYFTELKNTQFSRGKKKKKKSHKPQGKKKKKKSKLFLFYLLVKENYKRGGVWFFFFFLFLLFVERLHTGGWVRAPRGSCPPLESLGARGKSQPSGFFTAGARGGEEALRSSGDGTARAQASAGLP